tara:strand:+ start:3580 stop:3903 length:324 start_codon:yes stop_codon:yes gene_type:complete
MTSESLYLCSRCKQKKNIHNVKFDRWGKLTCTICLGEEEPIKKEIDIPKPTVVNFICINCRFKFRIKRGSPRKVFCPYCGRTNIMHVKRYKDENDLIEEASDGKYDF